MCVCVWVRERGKVRERERELKYLIISLKRIQIDFKIMQIIIQNNMKEVR